MVWGNVCICFWRKAKAAHALCVCQMPREKNDLSFVFLKTHIELFLSLYDRVKQIRVLLIKGMVEVRLQQ